MRWAAMTVGFYGYVAKDLRRVLGIRQRMPYAVAFCGRGRRAACRRALARSLPTTWTMQAYNDLMIRHVPAATALWPSAYAAALGCIYLSLGMIAASKLFR